MLKGKNDCNIEHWSAFTQSKAISNCGESTAFACVQSTPDFLR